MEALIRSISSRTSRSATAETTVGDRFADDPVGQPIENAARDQLDRFLAERSIAVAGMRRSRSRPRGHRLGHRLVLFGGQ